MSINTADEQLQLTSSTQTDYFLLLQSVTFLFSLFCFVDFSKMGLRIQVTVLCLVLPLCLGEYASRFNSWKRSPGGLSSPASDYLQNVIGQKYSADELRRLLPLFRRMIVGEKYDDLQPMSKKAAFWRPMGGLPIESRLSTLAQISAEGNEAGDQSATLFRYG